MKHSLSYHRPTSSSSSSSWSQLLKTRVRVSQITLIPFRFPHPPLLSTQLRHSLTPMDDQRTTINRAAIVGRENGSPATSSPINTGDRIGEVKRVTKETNVSVRINLDGSGVADCSTGIPFLDHMLDQLASHGLFDVHAKAIGDIHIDDHHTNEDVALAIGTALLQALRDRKGINRFGDFSAPLDEALIHVSLLAGRNSHHIIEATFKAFARALRQATEYDPRRHGTVPSYYCSLEQCWCNVAKIDATWAMAVKMLNLKRAARCSCI
ncbi:hypothetical protein TEA_018497 [Camellia sinensis var. sinensis]|uniref:Imidazoleglycerol-phosphate dehydratase n=1 Tax=Camellia sinensis var. sinensis TaxID=542762 RepID=A0A4S4E5X0_CAMSN|nr:hypothetical protein TEA_018497 [Camellia sinensis var. sinensis]